MTTETGVPCDGETGPRPETVATPSRLRMRRYRLVLLSACLVSGVLGAVTGILAPGPTIGPSRAPNCVCVSCFAFCYPSCPRCTK